MRFLAYGAGLALAAMSCSSAHREAPHPRTIELLAGSPGEIVALVFLSDECPIANAMAPDIIDLAQESSRRKVRFCAIYAAPTATEQSVRSHAQDFGLSGSVAVSRDPGQSLTRAVGATMTPEGVVLRLAGDGAFEVLYRGRVNDLYTGIGRRRAHATSHDLRDAILAAADGGTIATPNPRPIGCFIELMPEQDASRRGGS